MSVTNPQRWQFDEDLESKYEIIDVLGGGGMGRVLRARHRQLKRLVAIKLLQHDLKASEAVTRFLREARAAAHIRSVHVAHVMDAGILRNGQPYIVMEYLQGQDLANMVALRGRLQVEQAVGFVLQALEAIAEAHSLQIIHRDIKPGNLFATRALAGETSIKVVDFGLAKTSLALDTLDPGVTERGAVLGTPSYMSPEQFVDAQDVDARTDIWGVGATLFELLTGTPPFTGASLPQIYTAVMHQPIPRLRSLMPELPEGLENVIATCLTRERAKRFANVAELAEALEPYAADSSREHVARIRRIVDGVRDSIDPFDVPEDEVLTSFGAPSDVPSVKPGVISSTFARNSRELALPSSDYGATSLKRRRYWVGLAALAIALLGAVAWTVASRHAPEALEHEAVPEGHPNPRGSPSPIPIPADDTRRSSPPLFEVQNSPATSTPVTAPEPGAPTNSASARGFVTPPPTVSRPTANRSRRTKVGPAGAANPQPPSSIYEQYP
jgi:serine/threonine-protein kinase